MMLVCFLCDYICYSLYMYCILTAENLILEKLGLVGQVHDGTRLETEAHGMETTDPADAPPHKRHCSSLSEQLDLSTDLI